MDGWMDGSIDGWIDRWACRMTDTVVSAGGRLLVAANQTTDLPRGPRTTHHCPSCNGCRAAA